MTVELASPDLGTYLDGLVPPRPAEMANMEMYAADNDFPIIGPAAGHLCYLVARIIGARRVFEMGSGYGYSTAWFARAVQENGGGVVHHVVWHEHLSEMARGHLGTLGYDDIVRYTVGEAVEALRGGQGPFDLIFMDIDKHAYAEALPVIDEKLRPGGVLIVDNMLWHGRVFDEDDRSAETIAIRELTRALTRDPRWTTSIIPIRDGVAVATKSM